MVAGSDVTISLLPGQSRLAQHETLGQARQNLRLVVVFLCSSSFFIIIFFLYFLSPSHTVLPKWTETSGDYPVRILSGFMFCIVTRCLATPASSLHLATFQTL